MVRREDGMVAGGALVKGSNSASVTGNPTFPGLNKCSASFHPTCAVCGWLEVQGWCILLRVFTRGHSPRIS